MDITDFYAMVMLFFGICYRRTDLWENPEDVNKGFVMLVCANLLRFVILVGYKLSFFGICNPEEVNKGFAILVCANLLRFVVLWVTTSGTTAGRNPLFNPSGLQIPMDAATRNCISH